MTGKIVGLNLDKGWNNAANKGKPFTTIKVDGKEDNTFDVAGEIGKLGERVEVTARVISDRTTLAALEAMQA